MTTTPTARPPFARLVTLIALLSPLLSPAAIARGHHHDRPPQDQAAPAYDYFLLSLSVAPSFCALAPSNAAKPECRTLTAADYRATPLTIHGLWPNIARVRTNQQPQDCDGPPFSLSDPVQSQLHRWMPAGPGLERYEWRKHGTCSGMQPDAYFAAEVHLAEQANAIIGTALLAQGTTIQIGPLLQAVAARDLALAQAIIVDCRTARGGGDTLVSEIRVTLSKDLRPVPASGLGMGQNSGCRGGVGHIPLS